ncbi:hypothetical protein NDU88_007075 [Pleurodeles waltl]|uniref:Uncharacterized protein n=1 Tax=Pleurodeles waltl TaxID=8319 RepID=A0AAV7LTM2_PLEWA|nr:hypothetical protein NDU88_007075 [Pleurodeles waltl]
MLGGELRHPTTMSASHAVRGEDRDPILGLRPRCIRRETPRLPLRSGRETPRPLLRSGREAPQRPAA